GFNDSAPATVSIEVGYQPTGDPQTRVTDVHRAISITLTGSDPCSTDSLSFAIVSGPALGSLSGTPPNVTYTPPSTAGDDSFTFKVNDGVRNSADATVSIVVLPGANLTAAGACDSIGLEWSIPSWVVPYVQDFVIYRSTTSGSYGSPLVTLPANSRTYTDTSISAGTTYYYVVKFHYTDPGVSTTPESVSNEASASTRISTIGGANDIVFIIDNTGSMGTAFLANLKDKIISILNCIEDYSGSDYRLALVTPDEDQVNVRVNFSANNRATFETGLDNLNGVDGGGTPESTDECLNTILNALAASGRVDLRSCASPGKTLQINDFTFAFRTNALKLVVLITDAEPGGFCDFGDNGAKAHQYALQARSNCVKINALHVALSYGGWDSTTETVMRDYQQTSCGWYSQAPHDGGDIVRYILKMFYENAYCNCP
ncbi:MAG: VWA domain-containing protein, partial [Verrucomicrobia bacterium]|nr:VWA domain-containing protein [Verrucomicrobiota bacterium]